MNFECIENCFLLYTIRKQLNLTQSQMGILFGLEKHKYCNLENGRLKFKLVYLETFCFHLKMNIVIYKNLLSTLLSNRVEIDFEISSHKYYGLHLDVNIYREFLITVTKIFHEKRFFAKTKANSLLKV